MITYPHARPFTLWTRLHEISIWLEEPFNITHFTKVRFFQWLDLNTHAHLKTIKR